MNDDVPPDAPQRHCRQRQGNKSCSEIRQQASIADANPLRFYGKRLFRRDQRIDESDEHVVRVGALQLCHPCRYRHACLLSFSGGAIFGLISAQPMM